MPHEVYLSEEEALDLNRLLRREVNESRVELRRTRNPHFRDEIQHRIELEEHVLDILGGHHMGA